MAFIFLPTEGLIIGWAPPAEGSSEIGIEVLTSSPLNRTLPTPLGKTVDSETPPPNLAQKGDDKDEESEGNETEEEREKTETTPEGSTSHQGSHTKKPNKATTKAPHLQESTKPLPDKSSSTTQPATSTTRELLSQKVSPTHALNNESTSEETMTKSKEATTESGSVKTSPLPEKVN